MITNTWMDLRFKLSYTLYLSQEDQEQQWSFTNTAHTDRLLILPFVCMHAIVLKDANAGQDFETRSGDNNKDFIDIKSKV